MANHWSASEAFYISPDKKFSDVFPHNLLDERSLSRGAQWSRTNFSQEYRTILKWVHGLLQILIAVHALLGAARFVTETMAWVRGSVIRSTRVTGC